VCKVDVICLILFLVSIYAHKPVSFSAAHRIFYVKTVVIGIFAGHHNPSFLNVSGFEYHNLHYVREMLTHQRPRIKRRNFYCNSIFADSDSEFSRAERNKGTAFTLDDAEDCSGPCGASSVLLRIMNAMTRNHGGT
jgi:hypothetical protein